MPQLHGGRPHGGGKGGGGRQQVYTRTNEEVIEAGMALTRRLIETGKVCEKTDKMVIGEGGCRWTRRRTRRTGTSSPVAGSSRETGPVPTAALTTSLAARAATSVASGRGPSGRAAASARGRRGRTARAEGQEGAEP